jgi:hypothetical protein
MRISRVQCDSCNVSLEGEFELSPFAALTLEEQMFAIAFLRHHGSIKKMESLFGISYPTVKNRLNAIAARLDTAFEAPLSNSDILDQLARGEITVAEALERLD